LGLISEQRFESHIPGKIANMDQGQYHNHDKERPSELLVERFGEVVEVDSNLVVVAVDSNLVVAVDSNLVVVAVVAVVVAVVAAVAAVAVVVRAEKEVFGLEQQAEEEIEFFQQLGKK
tara:strand:+ start:1226 stop:1579 length:354 start_codon:yes stop_codon:yes gene_type:complete